MKTPAKPRLTDRTRRIAALIERFGMATPEAIWRREYRGRPFAAALSAAARMRHANLITPHTLFDKYVYYQLTPRACRLLNVSSRASRPLGRQALIERYAVMWFCAVEPREERILFNPGREQAFSIEAEKLRRVHFYIDRSAKEPLMGQLVIDQGAPAFRLAQKAARRLSRYLAHGWIAEPILAESFELSFLVCSKSKAASLQHAFAKHLRDPLTAPLATLFGRRLAEFPIKTRTVTVPGLDQLVLRDNP